MLEPHIDDDPNRQGAKKGKDAKEYPIVEGQCSNLTLI
jgi:hypothetical protein